MVPIAPIRRSHGGCRAESLVDRDMWSPFMIAKCIATGLVAAVIFLAGCSQHEGMSGMPMDAKDGNTDMKAAMASGAVDLGNSVCPVSGDQIGDSKFIEVYNGKVYHFCCSDCPKDFKKDPEKYAKLVA